MLGSIASTHADAQPIFTGTSAIYVISLSGNLQSIIDTQISVVEDDTVIFNFQLLVNSLPISEATHINHSFLNDETYTSNLLGLNNASKLLVNIDVDRVDKSILNINCFQWNCITVFNSSSTTPISSI